MLRADASCCEEPIQCPGRPATDRCALRRREVPMARVRLLGRLLAAAAAAVVVAAVCGASAQESAALVLVAKAADTGAGGTPPELRGTSWRWVGAASPGESLAVDQPDRYTLAFVEDDRVALRADCNRGTGPVASPSPGALAIGPLAMTRARCPPGSLSDRYAQDVSRAARFAIRDGGLHLELSVDSGVLRFERGP